MAKPGGEVDAFCTKCELELAHTVIAVVDGRPVKVECNTCHGVHRYREPAGRAPPRPRAERPARERERPAAVPFETLLAARKIGDARGYSPRLTFVVDDVVDHPTFGRGFVSAVKGAGKVEVTFRGEVRVLVHGRT